MSDAVKRNYDFDSFIKDMKLEGYEFAEVEDLPCILHPNFSKAIPLALQTLQHLLQRIILKLFVNANI